MTPNPCEQCWQHIAVIATYWTDDAEFENEPAWTEAKRFGMLQKSVTDALQTCENAANHRVSDR